MNNSKRDNSVLVKEYRGYQYEIYLDAERDCLSGEIVGFEGFYDSDSLTHLKEQIERAIELEVNYKYQSQLAEENSKLKVEVDRWKKEVFYFNRMLGEIDEKE